VSLALGGIIDAPACHSSLFGRDQSPNREKLAVKRETEIERK